MSSIAKRIQEQQQSEQQKTVQTVIIHKTKISFGELVLLCALALAIAFAGVKIISNQSAIYQTNKEIQQTEASIDEQIKVTNDLAVQVDELSTYERIWKKAAELGLMLNENNVKVVQE
ncbi:cell division protein FtsL [Bacillus sp. CECT 9360]|uniref:cell division protein FtsL n=1 Tax=Bacillus sp. CECT 9360 TaxID=2845821 RepID=UPI001E2FA72E|nr:cell division protein FtsL [Bacillus sp. CECT 9360]CAH0346886.1 Cell division protein FtsL [Bacillus sp. CECT 9360]